MELLKPAQIDTRLCELVNGIDLQELSRVPSSRLADRALPNIGVLELVSADAFETDYDALYKSMFHGGERERSDLIIDRLRDDFAGRRTGLAPYRIVGIRDPYGEAVGAAQFSVLMLEGGRYAVPYLQYIYVRSQNRRQDMSEVLHTMVLAVATADAKAAGDGRTVPFTLFETEPPGHGTTQSSQTTATERTNIHARSGSQALMLRDGKGSSEAFSAHVQPGLEHGEGPLTLIWATRPSPKPGHVYNLTECGKALAAAYYHSLRDEGFPEKNIALAEQMVQRRVEGREFFEMPLADVTADMYKDLEDMVELER